VIWSNAITKKLKTLLLAAGLALGVSTAQAQNFDGAYAGAPINATGWYGGVQAGYNFSTGSGIIAGVGMRF
jgi:opacity protein-like surface antigen